MKGTNYCDDGFIAEDEVLTRLLKEAIRQACPKD
jgi:hypothetical protein